MEFVTTFRKFAIQQRFPAMGACGEAALERALEKGEVTHPAKGNELAFAHIRSVFTQVPIFPAWQRFVRSQQEMMRRRTRESFVRSTDQTMRAVTAAEPSKPERIHVDPDFSPLNSHCARSTANRAGTPMIHWAVWSTIMVPRIFFEGANKQYEPRLELAEKTTLPAVGKVKRILNVGCSIGQATTVLKDLHPDAEVWGLDVGLPLIRYAHMRAIQRGKNVHLK